LIFVKQWTEKGGFPQEGSVFFSENHLFFIT